MTVVLLSKDVVMSTHREASKCRRTLYSFVALRSLWLLLRLRLGWVLCCLCRYYTSSDAIDFALYRKSNLILTIHCFTHCLFKLYIYRSCLCGFVLITHIVYFFVNLCVCLSVWRCVCVVHCTFAAMDGQVDEHQASYKQQQPVPGLTQLDNEITNTNDSKPNTSTLLSFVHSEAYLADKVELLSSFEKWSECEQSDFVQLLLSKMSHSQHSEINTFLKPMLQRDFISLLPSK